MKVSSRFLSNALIEIAVQEYTRPRTPYSIIRTAFNFFSKKMVCFLLNSKRDKEISQTVANNDRN